MNVHTSIILGTGKSCIQKLTIPAVRARTTAISLVMRERSFALSFIYNLVFGSFLNQAKPRPIDSISGLCYDGIHRRMI